MNAREILLEIIKREVNPSQHSLYTGPSVTLEELAEKTDEIVKKLRQELDTSKG